MKYKDLEYCDDCPLYKDLCPGGWTSSPSGSSHPIEPPCIKWNDEDDMDEIYNKIMKNISKEEDKEIERLLKKQKNIIKSR